MGYFDDGWIDSRHPEAISVPPREERNADLVREEIERFRGKVLSAAYGLERSIDTLIVLHLFKFRADGTAAFFDEHILQGLGLERKVRLARLIVSEWHDEDLEKEKLVARVTNAKSYRDRIAHWPTRLQPLTIQGRVVDYRAHLEKGNASISLDDGMQTRWLAEIVQARLGMEALAVAMKEHFKLGFDDE